MKFITSGILPILAFPNGLDLIQQLIKAGGQEHYGEASASVYLQLDNDWTLRIGVTDTDIAENDKAWVQLLHKELV